MLAGPLELAVIHSEILLVKDMMSSHYKIPFQDLSQYFKTVLGLHAGAEKLFEDQFLCLT